MPGPAKWNRCAIIAVVACFVGGLAGSAEAERWLVEQLPRTRAEDATKGARSDGGAVSYGSTTGTAAATSAGGRKSLDVDLVVAIIQDRAKQAALRVVADTLDELSLADQPVYIDELIERSVHLIGSSSGLRKDMLIDVAYILVRAVVARAILETALEPPGQGRRGPAGRVAGHVA